MIRKRNIIDKYYINIIGSYHPWEWRNEIIDYIYEKINSFEESHYFSIIDPRDRFFSNQEIDNNPNKISSYIVYSDIEAILRSDLIIGYLPDKCQTIGTYMELSWSLINHSQCKIIIITQDAFVIDSPWIKKYANKIVPDFESAKSYIDKYIENKKENIKTGLYKSEFEFITNNYNQTIQLLEISHESK